MQPSLARGIMAPVNPASVRGERGNEDDPAPSAGGHTRDTKLGEDEGCAQVDAERVVELVETDVGDVGDAFAVPGVGYEDVWAVLAGVFADTGEEAFDVGDRGDVDFKYGYVAGRVTG